MGLKPEQGPHFNHWTEPYLATCNWGGFEAIEYRPSLRLVCMKDGNRENWRSVVDTATLKKSMPWEKDKYISRQRNLHGCLVRKLILKRRKVSIQHSKIDPLCGPIAQIFSKCTFWRISKIAEGRTTSSTICPTGFTSVLNYTPVTEAKYCEQQHQYEN